MPLWDVAKAMYCFYNCKTKLDLVVVLFLCVPHLHRHVDRVTIF